MSSHREAPAISKDPVADSTDFYAFVSPDHPSSVTLIANYIPLEGPAGGPNFYEFGDDVLYEIHVDNDGDARAEITFQFRFKTHMRNHNTFLYNIGQITSLSSTNWNRYQTYSVTRIQNGHADVLGTDLIVPPVNIGPRSTPNYHALAKAGVHSLPGGIKVFAGQRREGFFVDLGAVFDLGDLRPFQNLHVISTPAAPGVDSTVDLSVHSIAIRVPKRHLTKNGTSPTNVSSAHSVIGAWTSASRRKGRILEGAHDMESGPWIQVSRLANPLFNEVIVPMAHKDRWNALKPHEDAQFESYVKHPELGTLLNILYPGIFPNLAAYSNPRADLDAILLTGIPNGIVAGFQNFTGATPADMLRLNMAIPPTLSSPNPLGLIAGDAAGFPNGRRVFDDVVTVELRAIAGVTIPLVDGSYSVDGAASLVEQGVGPGPNRYLTHFPYLGDPKSGFEVGA